MPAGHLNCCFTFFYAAINTEIVERDLIVTQPDPAIFVCLAVSIPRPAITWYQVEVDNLRRRLTGMELGVSITEEKGIFDNTTNSTLELNPTGSSFSAVYICEATNPLSRSEANATLFVKGTYIDSGTSMCVY